MQDTGDIKVRAKEVVRVGKLVILISKAAASRGLTCEQRRHLNDAYEGQAHRWARLRSGS